MSRILRFVFVVWKFKLLEVKMFFWIFFFWRKQDDDDDDDEREDGVDNVRKIRWSQWCMRSACWKILGGGDDEQIHVDCDGDDGDDDD